MPRLEIDFLTQYDDQSLLAELRRVAEVTGSHTVTKADLKKIGRVSHATLVRRFASLRHALHLAGLKSERFTKATDDELLAIIISLWQQVLEKEGRSPQKKDLEAYGFPVSEDTICRRFGTWRKALVRAHASITEESVSAEPPDARARESRKRTPLSIRKRFFVLKRSLRVRTLRCERRRHKARSASSFSFRFRRQQSSVEPGNTLLRLQSWTTRYRGLTNCSIQSLAGVL